MQRMSRLEPHLKLQLVCQDASNEVGNVACKDTKRQIDTRCDMQDDRPRSQFTRKGKARPSALLFRQFITTWLVSQADRIA